MRTRKSHSDAIWMTEGVILFSFYATLFATWATHVVWVIKILSAGTATASQMVLGAIGTFMPFVGMIHGLMIWFGYGA